MTDRNKSFYRSQIRRFGLISVGILMVGMGWFQAATSASPTLDARTQQAMIDAIKDEYQARALYSAVLQKFGSVRPFRNIVQAENRHVELWKTLFARYGMAVPADTFAGQVTVPDTLAAACQAGVKDEQANVALYDRFLSFVQPSDLRSAFTQLRQVSQSRHLPAFQRCAGR